jgi:hypothetical protein
MPHNERRLELGCLSLCQLSVVVHLVGLHAHQVCHLQTGVAGSL